MGALRAALDGVGLDDVMVAASDENSCVVLAAIELRRVPFTETLNAFARSPRQC